jgi:putative flippase GtrA
MMVLTPNQRQLVGFLLSGGVAAIVNVLSRILLNRWMPYSAAIVVAYILGMSTAFLLNRLFVFRNAGNALHHQIFWFTMVNIAAVLQTLAVSLILAKLVFPRMNFVWHADLVAHSIGVAVPVLTSFVGHKKLSFRESV